MNPLFIQFENDPTVYTFYVNMHCKLSDAIEDIQNETNKKVVKASYNKF
jgi:hypothetical protein